tara:strand:- start:34 stop:297 length:264 start_codon:yes stop_codon:yes gene_type:complete
MPLGILPALDRAVIATLSKHPMRTIQRTSPKLVKIPKIELNLAASSFEAFCCSAIYLFTAHPTTILKFSFFADQLCGSVGMFSGVTT